MLYGTPQAGYNGPPNQGLNIASLPAGQQITLLNGTEAIQTGSKSVSFARGFHDAFNSPITFNLSGCKAGTVIEIQEAGADIDGQYTVVATLTPDANGNQVYTLTDSAPFLRAYVSTFESGDAPVLTATRL
jgi:hypothetical protein